MAESRLYKIAPLQSVRVVGAPASLCANSGHSLSTHSAHFIRDMVDVLYIAPFQINDRDRVVVLVGHVEDLARLILREQLPRSGTAKRMQKPRFRPRPQEHRRRARLA